MKEWEYAVNALYDAEEGSTTDVLAQCIQRLESLEEYASDIAGTASLLKDALIHVQESATQLHHMLDQVEADPQRLGWVEQRIGVAMDLARKHKCEPDKLPEVLESMAEELSDIEDTDSSLEQLEQQRDQTLEQYHAIANEISKTRSETALRLSEAVTEQMQTLGMAGGHLKIEIDPGKREPARHGYDRVEFQVSTNPGQPAKALSKVVSGGEFVTYQPGNPGRHRCCRPHLQPHL